MAWAEKYMQSSGRTLWSTIFEGKIIVEESLLINLLLLLHNP